MTDEMQAIAERNLLSYVERHAPEGSDRQAALRCIETLAVPRPVRDGWMHFVGGEDIAAANFDNMVWTDDGEHTVKMNLVEVREEDCPADSPQEASDG